MADYNGINTTLLSEFRQEALAKEEFTRDLVKRILENSREEITEKDVNKWLRTKANQDAIKEYFKVNADVLLDYYKDNGIELGSKEADLVKEEFVNKCAEQYIENEDVVAEELNALQKAKKSVLDYKKEKDKELISKTREDTLNKCKEENLSEQETAERLDDALLNLKKGSNYKLTDAVKTFVKTAVENSFLSKMIEPKENEVEKVKKVHKNIFKEGFKSVREKFNDFKDFMTKDISMADVKDFMTKDLTPNLTEKLNNLHKQVEEKIENGHFFEKAKNIISKGFEKAKELGSKALDGAKELGSKIGNAIENKIEDEKFKDYQNKENIDKSYVLSDEEARKDFKVSEAEKDKSADAIKGFDASKYEQTEEDKTRIEKMTDKIKFFASHRKEQDEKLNENNIGIPENEAKNLTEQDYMKNKMVKTTLAETSVITDKIFSKGIELLAKTREHFFNADEMRKIANLSEDSRLFAMSDISAFSTQKIDTPPQLIASLNTQISAIIEDGEKKGMSKEEIMPLIQNLEDMASDYTALNNRQRYYVIDDMKGLTDMCARAGILDKASDVEKLIADHFPNDNINRATTVELIRDAETNSYKFNITVDTFEIDKNAREPIAGKMEYMFDAKTLDLEKTTVALATFDKDNNVVHNKDGSTKFRVAVLQDKEKGYVDLSALSNGTTAKMIKNADMKETMEKSVKDIQKSNIEKQNNYTR